MPMFSPLVMIIEVPSTPPSSDISASPRIVFGTSWRMSIGLPTISATATVCPVASTIEITLKISSGTAATTSKTGMPNGSRVGVVTMGPAATVDRSM